VEFGVQMAHPYESVIDAAQLAEKWGLAAVKVADHYLMSYDMETWDLPAYDALVQLAGLSRETSRIEIGTLVTPITFRHPAVAAKSAVTAQRTRASRSNLPPVAVVRLILHSKRTCHRQREAGPSRARTRLKSRQERYGFVFST